MKTWGKVTAAAVIAAIALVSACGTDDPSSSGGTSARSSIGPAGGVVSIEGVSLTVPPGALDSDTEIAIARTDRSPGSFTALSPVYRFTPDGLTFRKAAIVEIGYQGGSANAAIQWSAGSGGEFSALATTTAAGRAKADVTHFSEGFVAAAEPTTSPDGGTDSGGGGNVDTQAIAEAYCGKLFECLPVDAKALWADVPACRARIDAKLQLVVKAPGVTLDAAGAMACTTTLASGACGALRSRGLGVSPIEPLKPCKVKGSLAAGTTCGTGAQCTSGFCNGFESNCGKCTALIAENEKCGLGTECERGFACSSVCVKPAEENQPCGGANPPCSPELECVQNVCQKHLAPAAACGGSEGEQQRTCDQKQGYYCALSDGGTDGTCTAYSFANAGGSCASARCANSACVSGTTCTAYLADGQPCPTGEGPQLCQMPGRCLAGTCGIFDPSTCK